MSGYPWPVRLEPNSVLWWISFQITVSDSPVVLEVPMAKIKRRSQATSSNFSTYGGERWGRQQGKRRGGSTHFCPGHI